jgi:CHRD domain-containing protein
MRSRLLVPLFALALTGATTSCNDEITALNRSFEEDATWEATLNGANESPPVTTPATGRAWLVDRGNTIDYYMEYSGLLANASNAHIHRTATGAVMIQLAFVRQTNGVVVGTIDVSPSVTDVSPSPPGETGNQTVAELRTLLGNGGVYVNVHSSPSPPGFPGGEIRGTINPK